MSFTKTGYPRWSWDGRQHNRVDSPEEETMAAKKKTKKKAAKKAKAKKKASRKPAKVKAE